MKPIYVTFETAKMAKEAGFTAGVDAEFAYTQKGVQFRLHDKKSNQDIAGYEMPTQDLLHKWLRDEHDTWIEIYKLHDSDDKCFKINQPGPSPFIGAVYADWEDAMENALQCCLEWIIEQQNFKNKDNA